MAHQSLTTLHRIVCLGAVAFSLLSCDHAPREYAVEGQLSVVLVQSTGGFPYRYLLDAGDVKYELKFSDATEFVNIKSTPSGEVWIAGGWYGVNGLIEGKSVDVAEIEYLGRPPAVEQPERTEPIEVNVPPPAAVAQQKQKPPPNPMEQERAMAEVRLIVMQDDCLSLDDLTEQLAGQIAALEDRSTESGLGEDEVQRSVNDRVLDGYRQELTELLAEQSRCRKQLADWRQHVEALEKQQPPAR